MKARPAQPILLLAIGSLLVLTNVIWAQEDPPSRVGRLSYVQGQVSFEPAGVEEWAPAEMNRPVSTGDRLWADSDGRAAIQVGSAEISLNSQTSFAFLNLSDRTVQIRLTEGDLIVRLRHLTRDEAFEIDTPNVAVSMLHNGEYRVQARPEGYTIVIVRDGEAELTGGGQSIAVHKHKFIQVTGTDSLTTNVGHEPERDGFDRFCESRSHREARFESARYVPLGMVGGEDLDENGFWRDSPEYGHVWFPRGVAAGWAPYHDGHWAWADPWGWNWVDDAPWGFAPFHYGRWAHVGENWGWVPGPSGEEPVYAPALVGFVEAGEGLGWFPLGPGEVYAPGYEASPGYWNHVNNSNTVINKTTNITNIYNNRTSNNNSSVVNQTYVNRTVPGAVTAVPRNAFSGGRSAAHATLAMTPQQVASAHVTHAPAVSPTRQAVVAPAAGAQVVRPPASAVNRAVIAKRTPPPPPVPFAQQQQALAANPGRPVAPAMLQSMRQGQPVQSLQAPAVRPLGRDLRPAPSPATTYAAGHANQPIIQPPTPVAPRASNPDRPSLPSGLPPNVAPRASNPDRPSLPPGVSPSAAPRASNPDRPSLPPGVSPSAAPRASTPDRPSLPSGVPSNVAPRASNPDRPSLPPGVSPNVAPRASNPDRPSLPSGVSPNVAPRASSPDRPSLPSGVPSNVAPRASNPAPRSNNAERPYQPPAVQPNVSPRVHPDAAPRADPKPAPRVQPTAAPRVAAPARVQPPPRVQPNPAPHVNNAPPAARVPARTPPPPARPEKPSK